MTLLAAEPERVAVLLHELTQKALAEPLRTYVADVEARFPVKLQVVARDWKTPEEVRAAIKSLHREKAIAGVLCGRRRFFAKTHDYYTGKAVPELRTLLHRRRRHHLGGNC